MTSKSPLEPTSANDRSRDMKKVSGLVLVCQDLPAVLHTLELQPGNLGWQIKPVELLCQNPDRMTEYISEFRSSRLVLVLCSGKYSAREFNSHARRARIDSFGIQIVDLSARNGNSAGVANAAVAISGAISRAEAFPGTRPENIRTVFPNGDARISRRALFTIPPFEYIPVPTIDRATCHAGLGCNQCEKACPHGALKNVGGTIQVDTSACRSCGICVAACPQRAVEFPGYSADEIESHVEALIGSADGPLNIVFACEKSSKLPGNDCQVVRVACAAMVPTAALLNATAMGARSTSVLRCTEQCSQKATSDLEGRTDYVQEILERVGDDPSRVSLMPPADAGKPLSPPDVCEPFAKSQGSALMFGRHAAGASLLAISERTQKAIDPFNHGYSPIGIPMIDQAYCTMCGTCAAVCPTAALRQEDADGSTQLSFDAADCIACGECVASCPERATGAIKFELRTDLSALSAGPVAINYDETVLCGNCDQSFTSAKTLDRLEQLLGDAFSFDRYGTLCPECRTLGVPG